MKINLNAEIDTDNANDRELIEEIIKIMHLIKHTIEEDTEQ